MSNKSTLVLAGGSVKAAYQVGVLKALFQHGYEPGRIYGISAGAMNASFLTNVLGKQALKKETINFEKAILELEEFWLDHIYSPDCLAKRRGTYELGLNTFRKNYEGLLDTEPLKNLVHGHLKVEYLKAAPIQLKVGAVNILDGEMQYVSPEVDHFLDYIMASSAIPILMPVIKIGNDSSKPFLDGALRDVAPVRKAIEDGASEIYCIACHSKTMEGSHFQYGNLLALVDRIMDISVNESLNSDLDWAKLYNQSKVKIETDEKLKKFNTPIPLHIIRPLKPLAIDIQEFARKDIAKMIEIGYNNAILKLNKK